MISTLLLGAALAVAPLAAEDDAAARAAALHAPSPSVTDLDAWRAHVRPTADESAAETIAWLPDMVSGLRRSEAEQRPLLLWLMNGHPLGCT